MWVGEAYYDSAASNGDRYYRFIPTAATGANSEVINTSLSPRRAVRSGGAAGDMIERHLDTSNFLFTDGHVKSMRLDVLLKPGTGATGAPSMLTIQSD